MFNRKRDEEISKCSVTPPLPACERRGWRTAAAHMHAEHGETELWGGVVQHQTGFWGTRGGQGFNLMLTDRYT